MRRFDSNVCFGSLKSIRFLLLSDLTQKIYISGLQHDKTSQKTIERELKPIIAANSGLWNRKCIVTYRNNLLNHARPFAYVRVRSIVIAKNIVNKFDHSICFGNTVDPVQLEFVNEEFDLLPNSVTHKHNKLVFFKIMFRLVMLPITLWIELIYLQDWRMQQSLINIAKSNGWRNNIVCNMSMVRDAKSMCLPGGILTAIFFDSSWMKRLLLKNNYDDNRNLVDKFQSYCSMLFLVIFIFVMVIVMYSRFLLYDFKYTNNAIFAETWMPIILYIVLVLFWPWSL